MSIFKQQIDWQTRLFQMLKYRGEYAWSTLFKCMKMALCGHVHKNKIKYCVARGLYESLSSMQV